MTNHGNRYVFGDLDVDTGRFRVERAGRPAVLEPKAFDLLILLIERHGQVVTKQEILERIWTDTAVTDNALTRVVAQLRKAIGDDARDARFIETVPTRGYRWLPEPEVAAAPVGPGLEPPETNPTPSRSLNAGGWGRYTFAAVGFGAAALAAIGAVVIFRGPSPAASSWTPSTVTMRTEQLTVSPVLDAFPTLSPDGRLIAYTTNKTGAFELHVRTVSGGAVERAVTADGQQNVQPAWSPDGELIAYHSRRRGGIWIVPALGGAPRLVSEFGSRPAWSPDGRHLAFQSDPCTDISPHAYSANIPSVIWIVDRDGSHPRAVTTTGFPIGAHGSPAWSPDARRIAFVTSAAGSPQLWVVTADGGEPARVGQIDRVYDPVFSPDGKTIYAATGGEAIFAIPISEDTGQATGHPTRLAAAGAGIARHLSISRDGRHVAMARMDVGSHIWTPPMAGDRTTGPAAEVTVERVPRQTRPAFSPSGAELAFWTRRPGAGSEVWTVNPAGGPSSPVMSSDLANPVFYLGPTWVGGGRELVFKVQRESSVRMARMDLDSRRETTLLESQAGDDDVVDPNERVLNAEDLAVSPDGTTAVYSQIDLSTGRPRLYLRRFAEQTARPLTSGEFPERFPVWSPDGRTLAFELKKGDATNIALVSAAGGSPRLITAERNESWPYGWSPDGDKIVYAALRQGLWNLWWVSSRTGTAKQLTQYKSADTFVRYPAWSPRGDRIAYELGTVTGNIWIGWLP
jgi:Tol biopolymer transport system component/DNA-binding winged helix-turn-helix (wHTH) protein